MTGEQEDIGFTFDPQPFLRGLKSVEGGLQHLGDRTVKATQSMGKAFMWAQLKAQAIAGLLKGAFATMKTYMPEIDRAISISKDIFLKNFLWPLRQAIAPYLQKLLDWVRDNRAMFVKWGAVVANVFKVAIVLVKGLWTMLKSLILIFQPLQRMLFKGGIGDFVNLLLTKVAVLLAWITDSFSQLTVLIRPILDDIISIVDNLVKIVWDSLKGFFEEISKAKIGEGIKLFFDTLKEIAASKEFHDFVVSFLELIGKIAATAWDLAVSFFKGVKESTLGTAVKTLANAFTKLFNAVKDLLDNPKVKKFLDGVAEWLGQTVGTGLADSLNMISSILNILSGVIDALNGKKVDWGKIFGNMGKSVWKTVTDNPVLKWADTQVGQKEVQAVTEGKALLSRLFPNVRDKATKGIVVDVGGVTVNAGSSGMDINKVSSDIGKQVTVAVRQQLMGARRAEGAR
jgi:hypothetical protein